MFLSNRRVRLAFYCLTLAVALPGCESPPPDVPIPDSRLSDWAVHADNPLIGMGDYFDKAVWNDPCVLKTEDGNYVMYMTSSTEEPFQPPVLPFRAVSTDGLDWKLEPETPLLDAKGTPYANLETPSVVFFKGQYHMYYTGLLADGGVPLMAIGHATSPDGIEWTKDTREAALAATGDVQDWNGFLVAEPAALVRGDRIHLYFSALGARPGGTPPQLQVIGLATSTDGSVFDKPRALFGQSEIYPPEDGFVGYSTPTAVVHDGRVHLFYDVAHFHEDADPQWQQVALHHAVSEDGETDFVQDEAPIFARADFEWITGEVRAPSVLVEDGLMKMWFAGHARHDVLFPELFRNGWKSRKIGIGLATIADSHYDRRDPAPTQ